MTTKIKIKPIYILYISMTAFCMKLMEIQKSSPISHPLKMFYIISAIAMYAMVLFSLMTKKYFCYRMKKDRKNKYFNLIVGIWIFYYLLFGIFLVDYKLIKHVNSILIYTLYFLIFIFFVSKYVYRYNLIYKFVNISYICIALFLGICFIQNFDGFQILNHLSGIFGGSYRYFNEYGLYHKNALGNISLCLLLLSFYISVYKKHILNSKKTKVDYMRNLYNIIIFMMLLSSGSRSSLTGFFLFLLLYFFMCKFSGIKNTKFKYTTYFIIIMLIIFIAIFLGTDLWQIFLNESNRDLNFSKNIPVLFESNRSLIGIGLVNPGMFGDRSLSASTFYVDNYFLYVLMSTGIIGFIIVSLILTLLLLSIIKIDKVDDNLKNCVICIFLIDLYIGLFETSIVNALFPSSFIYLVIILHLIQCNNMDDLILINKSNVHIIKEEK